MTSREPLEEFILKNIAPSPGSEIIFFGGSFNPWHQGHESCIKLLKKSQATLIIIPDQNPHKQALHKNERSSTQAIQDFIKRQQGPKLFLYEGFLEQKKPNPSVLWVKKLKEQMPSLKLSFLMGFDSFANLSKWIEFDLLLSKLERIYIVSRLENQAQRQSAQTILKEKVENLPEIIFLGHHDFEKISSSSLRNEKS